MQRISASDAMFLDIEGPKSPLIIGGLFILDPTTAPGSFVRHRDILAYAESRLHVAPNLRRKLIYHPLGWDEPRLIDDPDFDLEFHVRHIALPQPRDLRQLKILASRLISRPMDLHRPLWEMYIIEGLEHVEGAPSDAFAMLFKMHHATFDGKAAGAAIWAFMQDTPEYEPVPPENRWIPDRNPDALGWTVSSIQEGFQQLLANTKAMPAIGKGLARIVRNGIEEGITEPLQVPRTRFQKKITSHRVFDWVSWEMQEVQALRLSLGKPKMNDLLVSVVGGALRRYFLAHNELPEQSLVALCPISVRGAGDPLEGGNHVSMMRATLGTDIADPIERLKMVAATTAQGKKQAAAVGGEFAGNFLGLSPYSLRSGLMRGITKIMDQFDIAVPLVANTIVTNVPNPPGGHYFTGAKVLSYAGFGPISEGIGIFHPINGMDFEVTISVTSCRELLPDLPFYMQCLRDSFTELREAAASKSGDRRASPSSRPARRNHRPPQERA